MKLNTSLTSSSMSISANEALRLKNEIKTLVGHAKALAVYAPYRKSTIVYGEHLVDDVLQSPDTGFRFDEFMDQLHALLNYSNEINTQLGEFNTNNNIGSLIRHRSNLEDSAELLTNALEVYEPEHSVKSTLVAGIGKVEEKLGFRPFKSQADVQFEISAARDRIRDIDQLIAAANTKLIELSFSFRDIDSIRSYFRR